MNSHGFQAVGDMAGSTSTAENVVRDERTINGGNASTPIESPPDVQMALPTPPGSTSQVPASLQTTSMDTADVSNLAQRPNENAFAFATQLSTSQGLPMMPRIPDHTIDQQELAQDYARNQQTAMPHPTSSRSLLQNSAPANDTSQQSFEQPAAAIITTLEAHVRQVQLDNHNQSDEIAQLKAQNAHLTSIIDGRNASDQHWRALVNRLQAQNLRLQGRDDRAVTVNAQLRQALNEAVQHYLHYVGQNSMQAGQIMIRDFEIQRLSHHLSAEREKAALIEMRFEEQTQIVRHLRFEVEEKTMENEDVVASGKFLLALNRKLRKMNSTLNTENEELKERLEQSIMDDDADNADALMEQTIDKLPERFSELQARFSDLERRVAKGGGKKFETQPAATTSTN